MRVGLTAIVLWLHAEDSLVSDSELVAAVAAASLNPMRCRSAAQQVVQPGADVIPIIWAQMLLDDTVQTKRFRAEDEPYGSLTAGVVSHGRERFVDLQLALAKGTEVTTAVRLVTPDVDGAEQSVAFALRVDGSLYVIRATVQL